MKKTAAVILILISVLFIFAGTYPDSEKYTLDGTINYVIAQKGEKNIQKFLDNRLSTDVGGEWYILAFIQKGEELDYSKCRSFYEDYTEKNEIKNDTTALKTALVLEALESKSSFISKSMERVTDDSGLMTLVFALHLINNGVQIEMNESVIERIISLVNPDGGWSVTGETSDVDATAMVIQALAPHKNKSDVSSVIDTALDLLSVRQKENGGFDGITGENSESCAQVIIALSALGIDCQNDKRFIKDGNSVLRAMLEYRTRDGGFRHVIDDKEPNNMATSQAICALVAHKRLLEGKRSFYLTDYLHQKAKRTVSSTRLMLCLAIILFFVFGCIRCIVQKKATPKTIGFLAVISAVFLFVILLMTVESKQSHYTVSDEKTDIRTSISIRCDSIVGKSDLVPADAVILSSSDIMLGSGSTAYDQLLKATKKYGIALEHSGGEMNAYIEGIAYIYELDFGELSGWMFKVNGAFADKGCSEYILRQGDKVEWLYTTDLGRDIS